MKSISRRTLLGQTSLLGSARAVGLPLTAATDAARSNEPKDSRRKLKVIVTGGHPGDPEYGCGGTITRYTDLGHEVVLLYLNRGEWPPSAAPESGAARVAEATKACEILKARPLYAGQMNGRAVVDPAQYEAFRKLLEAQRPDVVFTHWPIDNHNGQRVLRFTTTRSPMERTRSISRRLIT
jgi:N-acetylglucosamine malate deacetylase 1